MIHSESGLAIRGLSTNSGAKRRSSSMRYLLFSLDNSWIGLAELSIHRQYAVRQTSGPDRRILAPHSIQTSRSGKRPVCRATCRSNPDEVYRDAVRSIQLLRRADEDHFLAVVYKIEKEDEGFMMTAYFTNAKRKNRRYRTLQRLRQY